MPKDSEVGNKHGYGLRSVVPLAGEDKALWSLEDEGAAGISVGLPRTPQGRLHEKLEREFGLNADRLPRVDFEDTGDAADQLLQMESREVRFHAPEVNSAVKSAANVILTVRPRSPTSAWLPGNDIAGERGATARWSGATASTGKFFGAV